MSYDEGSHNYKITARLKLSSNWLPNKFAISLLLVTLSVSGAFFFVPVFKENVSRIYDDVTIKIYSGINAMNQSIFNQKESFLNYINLEEKYRNLQEENSQLKIQNALYAHVSEENVSLKRILKYHVNNPKRVLSTQILTRSADGYVEFARLPVGSANGVQQNDVIVDEDKLIGRVLEVEEARSKVALITSPTSIVPVVFTTTNLKAILRGGYGGKLIVKLLHGDVMLPQNGELVMTSGDGYEFPPNMAVGKVTKSEPGLIEITPFFSLGNLYRVSILRG